ncbi:uncharacterized protein LOC122527743 [Frieseomelitta varia]|uniref:uncharacterized protein LOC122527743 n=1 Tax=Frieseomelitta varia TaxID=561572 RepID=UPI001CB69D78|nr:uncharacterized protein LOC122527743 [Frieseomelitta varia]
MYVFSRIGVAGGLRTIPIDRSRPDGYEEVDWYWGRPGVLRARLLHERRHRSDFGLWNAPCRYIITSNVMLHRYASKDPVATDTTGTRRTGKEATVHDAHGVPWEIDGKHVRRRAQRRRTTGS